MASVTVAERRQVGLLGRMVAWVGAARAPRADVLRLALDGTARLAPRGRALSISARAGTVLVTQEGDPADHVLAPGDAVRLAARGAVVIWALSDAAVAVEPPRRAA